MLFIKSAADAALHSPSKVPCSQTVVGALLCTIESMKVVLVMSSLCVRRHTSWCIVPLTCLITAHISIPLSRQYLSVWLMQFGLSLCRYLRWQQQIRLFPPLSASQWIWFFRTFLFLHTVYFFLFAFPFRTQRVSFNPHTFVYKINCIRLCPTHVNKNDIKFVFSPFALKLVNCSSCERARDETILFFSLLEPSTGRFLAEWFK